MLCLRLEQLLHPQDNFLPITCLEGIKRAAQRYAGQLIERALSPGPTAADLVAPSAAVAADTITPERPTPDFQEVDIDSL